MDRFMVRASWPMAATLFVVVAFGGQVRGDDILPPEWRGTPLGVEGHWTPDLGWTVQVYNRPNPDPSESMHPSEPLLFQDNDDDYSIFIPNWIDREPIKSGRLQIYWLGTAGGEPTLLGLLGFEPSPQGALLVFGGVVTDEGPIPPSPPGGANGWYWDFEIRPNPDSEQINFRLPQGSSLVQLDIDTMSIPEPASIALLGGLAIVMLRRRA